METLLEGGNGVNSLDPFKQDISPERYEVGTPATPAIAGLCAGIRFVRERTPQAIRSAEQALCKRLKEMLGNIPGITIYAPDAVGSTLLFNLAHIPSERVAAQLSENDICLRAGFHCSPGGEHQATFYHICYKQATTRAKQASSYYRLAESRKWDSPTQV